MTNRINVVQSDYDFLLQTFTDIKDGFLDDAFSVKRTMLTFRFSFCTAKHYPSMNVKNASCVAVNASISFTCAAIASKDFPISSRPR